MSEEDKTVKSENPNDANAGVSHGIARPISTFWYEKPQLWFAMIEAHFNRSRIKTEDVKYEFILSYLDDKLASEVEDIILNPPKVEPYTKLKKEIIQRLSQSQDQKIRRLLQQEELGDRKPSQFLRHLTSLAGPLLDENILRTLWLQRTPTHTQQILKAHPTMKIEDLAAIADSIGEVNIAPTVAATSLTDSTTSELLKRVEDLTKMVAELQNRRPRYRHNSRSRKISRTRSFSRQRNGSRQRFDTCWYHYKFGDKAKKCTQPCKMSGNEENRH
ncbi:uncharacterized protein LOC113365329 [Ctenocephalides felis]|uniref:uncharacterized protein LOC113365329 n=1 Tax=Ctenocephalides felis TaxID=7515 RepID=UPI000E6E38CB|nr:uncharacterized protein LOC113365329 [Ctenocephalides felis]